MKKIKRRHIMICMLVMLYVFVLKIFNPCIFEETGILVVEVGMAEAIPSTANDKRLKGAKYYCKFNLRNYPIY